jgi:hypothetical protein
MFDIVGSHRNRPRSAGVYVLFESRPAYIVS